MNTDKLKIPLRKQNEIMPKLKDSRLILHILDELDKTHLGDNNVKLNAFIVTMTAFLNEPNRRKSLCLKGGSSEGKDNLIRSILRLLPKQNWIFLTHATQAALQDDIHQYKIIAVSEVNLQNEDRGANSHLLETIKQMTEGGTEALKKDILTGMKTVKHIKQEQKTVIYSTTEATEDEELSTRFIINTIKSSPEKIKLVNDHTIQAFNSNNVEMPDSWVATATELMDKTKIKIPYTDLIMKLKIFDNNHPRSMRDTKRFMSCVCAITYIYQHQREVDDDGAVLSEPIDFLLALLICSKYFNYSYSGVGDQRIQNFIDAMNTYCDRNISADRDVFPRHKIQEMLNVSINTIKNLVRSCSDKSVIRFDHTEQSAIYYKRLKTAILRDMIKIDVDTMLTEFINEGYRISENYRAALEELKKRLITSRTIKRHVNNQEPETILLKCYVCGRVPSNYFSKKNHPLCHACYEKQTSDVIIEEVLS